MLHAALYVSVYVMRSRVWNLPSLGMRWRQVREKFPSTRDGHARERERETGSDGPTRGKRPCSLLISQLVGRDRNELPRLDD